MKIRYKNKDMDLHFNENGAMFYLTKPNGDVAEWMSSRQAPKADHNQAWILEKFLPLLMDQGIVTVTNKVWHIDEDGNQYATLCNIEHPLFNDAGFSPFGDFCRARLGQQCQYGSRYISGRLEGYPALGDGLRFNNGMGYDGKVRLLDPNDYHGIRIHRDDMDEFERRYRAYQEERLNG